MPYHRHPVPAQDEPLNVAKVERAPRSRAGPGITSRNFILRAPEQAAKKSPASLRLRRLYFPSLAHLAPLSVSTRDGLRFAVGDQRVDVLDRQPRIRLVESDRCEIGRASCRERV